MPPEVRFLKLFRGDVKFNNPKELEDVPGISTLEARSFPHTEYNLRVIALIKIPPKFYDVFSGCIVETNLEFHTAGIKAPNKIMWGNFQPRT